MIEALAHARISISVKSITQTISSLSECSAESMKQLGRSLLASYAYDNFNVALNVSVPTVEHGGSSLEHLTSCKVSFTYALNSPSDRKSVV